MRKDALTRGGHGRGMDNKKSRTSKRNHDRRIDKRRRQKDNKETKLFSNMTTDIEVYAWNAWARERGF